MSSAAGGIDPRAITPRAWNERGRIDRDLAKRRVPGHLRGLHEAVVERARGHGAHSLILSGSTARGQRTDISDLDYHLVGDKIPTRDLSAELDIHVLSPDKLLAEILEGDDFVQWSIRIGLLLFDDGSVFEAARLLVEKQPWPDVARKAEHAAKSLDLARRVVESGDTDGALIQVRTGLSLAARAYLLSVGVFPLSRAELPNQLVEAGRARAAANLAETIYGEPSLETLIKVVSEGFALLKPTLAGTAEPALITRQP